MNVTDLTQLYPLMAPELPKCPKAYMLQHLRNTCQDFAKRTKAFREELTVDLVEGQRAYQFRAGVVDAQIVDLFQRPLYRGAKLAAATVYSTGTGPGRSR
jgi:hypothetical protein